MFKRKDSKCANKIGENSLQLIITYNLKFRIKIMRIQIKMITFLVKLLTKE